MVAVESQINTQIPILYTLEIDFFFNNNNDDQDIWQHESKYTSKLNMETPDTKECQAPKPYRLANTNGGLHKTEESYMKKDPSLHTDLRSSQSPVSMSCDY